MNSTAVHSRHPHIHFSAFFKISLLAWRLPGLLTVLFHTIVLGWIVEIPFGNSRANSKISKFTHSYFEASGMSSVQPSYLQRCLYHWQEMVHCTIYARKSKHSTPKVIICHYVITLCSVFGQTIEIGYSPSFLLLWTLAIQCYPESTILTTSSSITPEGQDNQWWA